MEYWNMKYRLQINYCIQTLNLKLFYNIYDICLWYKQQNLKIRMFHREYLMIFEIWLSIIIRIKGTEIEINRVWNKVNVTLLFVCHALQLS